MPEVSVIIPFFNEEKSLPLLRERLTEALDERRTDYEVILVDDHSCDGGAAYALDWARQDKRVKYIRLARNSGAHIAVFAGLEECDAACAVMLAADLQTPPEKVPDLLDAWRRGYHVVWAYAEGSTTGPLATRLFSRIANRFVSAFVLPDWPSRGADFAVLDRKVVEALRRLRIRHTSMLATIVWLGFRQTAIPYVKQGRQHGASKWTWWRKVKLLIDTTVSFSYLPIRLMSALGLLMACAGLAYAVLVVIGRLAGWVAAGAGYAALMTVLLVGQGTIMAMLGVLGEYLWRTFEEAKNRPHYFIEQRWSQAPLLAKTADAGGQEQRANSIPSPSA